MNRKKLGVIFLLLVVLSFAGFNFVGYSYAATTASVTATVTVENISVSVADGTVSYGTLGLNSSAGTNGTDTQTASNDGNVAEDFNLKGSDSAAWTLDTANSTTDHYMHKFCTATCASAPTNYTGLTTSYQALASNVAALGNQTFDLYITTPQTSSVYTAQSVDVTVQAVIH